MCSSCDMKCSPTSPQPSPQSFLELPPAGVPMECPVLPISRGNGAFQRGLGHEISPSQWVKIFLGEVFQNVRLACCSVLPAVGREHPTHPEVVS